MGQQNLNPNFPQTSLAAVQNILNSNRSGSSQGFMTLKSGNNGASTAKAIGQFKFNLTLNRNKHQPNQKSNDYAGFYPTQQLPQQNNMHSTMDNQVEDQEANFMIQNERQQTLQPRGKSAMGTMGQRQQSKFKLVNMVYDDHQSIGGVPSLPQQQQQLILQDEDLQQLEQALDFDQEDPDNIINNVNKRQSRSQNTRNQNPQTNKVAEYFGQKLGVPVNVGKLNDTNVELIEERQKIFEEEIIKRIKEIQKYAKSLHLSIKKLQSSNGKKSEEWKEIKDQLVKIKDDIGKDDILNEQAVLQIIDHKINQLDERTYSDLQSLETKLIKDTEIKIGRQAKQSQYELQVQLDNFKEELMNSIQADIVQQVKLDLTKQVNDRFREATKLNEKTSQELSNQINALNLEFEDYKLMSSNQLKDFNVKLEKNTKNTRDQRDYLDQQVIQLNEVIPEQVEDIRKKIMKEVKNEYDFKQYASQTDLNDALQQFNSRISMLNESVNSRSQNTSNTDSLIQLESQISQLQQKTKNYDSQNQQFLAKVQQFERQINDLLTQDTKQNILDLHSEQIANLQSMIEQCQIDQQDSNQTVQQLQNQSNLVKVNDFETFKNQQLQKQQEILSQIDSTKDEILENLNQLNYQIEQQESKIEEVAEVQNNSSQTQQPQINVQLIEDQLTETILSQVDTKFNKVKQEISQIQSQIEQQQNYQQQQDNKIFEIQSELYTLNQQVQNNQEDFNTKFGQISLTSPKDSKSDEKIQVLQNDIQQLQEKLEDLGYQIEQANTSTEEIEQIKNVINDHQTKIQEFSQQVNDLEENQSIITQNISLQIESLKQEQQHQTNTINQNLNQSHQDLHSQIQNLEITTNNKIQSLEDLIYQQSQNNSNQQNSTYDESIIMHLKENIGIISKDLTLKLDKELFDANIIQLESSISQLREEVQDTQSQVTHMDAKFQNMIDEVYESQQNTSESIQNKINDVYEYIKQVEEKQNQIHLSSNTKEIEPASQSINQQELEEVRAKLLQIQEENAEQYEIIRNQVDDLSNLVNQQQQQLNNQPSALAELNSKLEKNNINYDNWINTIESNLEKLRQQQDQKYSDLQAKVIEQVQMEEVQQLVEQKISQIDNNVGNDQYLEEMQALNSKLLELEQKLQQDLPLLHENLETLEQQIVQCEQNQQEQLNTKLSQHQDEVQQQLNQLESKLLTVIEKLPTRQHVIPQIDMSEVQQNQIKQEQLVLPAGLDVSNINSCRSPQNFLGSAQKEQSQFKDGSNQKNENYQGHFLEDLSEADLSNASPNKQGMGNQTSDGDIMMFNNKTKSLGASSIMSNKLHTMFSPVEQKQIMFNQQLSNKLADQIINNQQDDQQQDDNDIVEEQKNVSRHSYPHQKSEVYENHLDQYNNTVDNNTEQHITQQYTVDNHDEEEEDYSQQQHLLGSMTGVNDSQAQKQQLVSHLEDYQDDYEESNLKHESPQSLNNKSVKQRSPQVDEEPYFEDEEIYEDEFIEEVHQEEEYKPNFAFAQQNIQQMTQAAKDNNLNNSQLHQSRYSKLSKDSDEDNQDLIDLQPHSLKQSPDQRQLSIDNNEEEKTKSTTQQQPNHQHIESRNDDFNLNNVILNQNSSEDDQNDFQDDQYQEDFDEEIQQHSQRNDLFEPSIEQNNSAQKQQNIYQQYQDDDEEEVDQNYQQQDDVYEQFQDQLYQQQEQQDDSQQYEQHFDQEQQLFDEEEDVQESGMNDEEYQEEEDDEEEIVLTPEQASDALAQWIFGDELDLCLEELEWLKTRKL